jgi:hypothetical protein
MSQVDRPSCAIIILNYKRARNIGPIVRRCRESARAPDIHVIDNSPDRSARYVTEPFPAVHYLPQERNMGCGVRYSVSLTLPHELTLCIDDDVFLDAVQIDALFDQVEQQPHRAHGIWGDGFVMQDGMPAFFGGATQRNVAAPMLNRVYGYSRAYLTDATQTAVKAGFNDWVDAGSCDYMLFSLCGATVPMCHALGPFGECATSNEAGIAVWKEGDFDRMRADFLLRLLPHIRHETRELEALTRRMWQTPKTVVDLPIRKAADAVS